MVLRTDRSAAITGKLRNDIPIPLLVIPSKNLCKKWRQENHQVPKWRPSTFPECGRRILFSAARVNISRLHDPRKTKGIVCTGTFCVDRQADPADTHVAVIDVPGDLVRMVAAAAGETGHPT